MATIDIEVLLGTTRVRTTTATISDALVRVAQDTMSEFDVLEMALHDAHYAGGLLQRLPQRGVVNLPPTFSVPRSKTSASNVVGNLGEGLAVAAFSALSCTPLSRIVRVRRQRARTKFAARRTPDFVASFAAGGGLRAISALMSSGSTRKVRSFPDRFPFEAKGALGESGAFWSATWQLIEYWHTVHVHRPYSPEIGAGLVACVGRIRAQQRTVRLHVLTPKQHQQFCTTLARLSGFGSTRHELLTAFGLKGGAPFEEA